MTLSRRRFAALVGAAAGAAALPGCVSTNRATGRTSFTGTMTPEAEVQVGNAEHPKLLEAFGGEYDNRRLQSYVARVGGSLTPHTEYRYPYRFTLLNSPIVNAFALPGGNVYISRGLLALASNEAEMAGVLAHELGHVNARHSAERYGAQQAAAIGITGAQLLAQLFLDMPAGLLNTGAQLAQAAAGAALQAYSRQQEFEADSLGVRYMSQAGYQPDAMVSFLSTLRQQSILDARARGLPDGTVDAQNMMSTHPRTIDRVQAALARADASRPATPQIRQREYLAELDGMLFGDDPRDGVIRGQQFLHGELAFTFEVPPGFRLANSPERVQASDARGAGIVFDMAPIASARDMPTYIANEWAAGARLAGLEAIEVNGMAAATGLAQVRLRSGSADARLLAIRRDPRSAYRFVFITPKDRTAALREDFQRTSYSFRRLSPAEAAAVRPLTVRIVAAPDRPVRELARELPYGSQNEAWFRVLNDLPEGARPRPGQLIKLVTA